MYLSAYALVSLSKAEPTSDDVANVLKAVNIAVDKETLAFVMESVKGNSAASLIAKGNQILSNNVSVAAAPAAAAGAAAPAAAGKPAPKKVEEPSDDDDGMDALF